MCRTGAPFAILVQNFASLYRQRQAHSVFWPQGLIYCFGSGSDGSERAVPESDADVVPRYNGNGTEAFWYHRTQNGRLPRLSLTIRHLPSTAIFFFSLPTSSSGVQSSASSGPRPPGNGRGQGQTPSQSLARLMGSRNKLETMVQRSQNRIVGNDRSTIAKMDRKRLTNDPKTGSLETIIRRS